MGNVSQSTSTTASRRVPLDVWAVLLALTLVALVRLGWFPGVSW